MKKFKKYSIEDYMYSPNPHPMCRCVLPKAQSCVEPIKEVSIALALVGSWHNKN